MLQHRGARRRRRGGLDPIVHGHRQGNDSRPTKPYTPDVTDLPALVQQISTALAGVKSCTFNLNNLDGKALKVNLQLLGKAHVLVQGREIPLDNTNGWMMATESELDLVGTACDQWRQPSSTTIDFQFPCDVIVPQ